MILAATDADQPGQTVSFSLTGGADQGKFQIVGGQLQFQTAPNYEVPTDANTDNEYVVEVTGTDSGTPALATVQTVTVTVTPVNDNPPVFTSNAAPSVPENTTGVVILAATDADQPAQTVSFSLTGGADQGKFQIVGGQLQFQTAPDYEVPTDANTDNKYVVEVTGTDSGTPALATVQTVSGDGHAGERQPAGIHVQRSASVPENTTGVVILAATDADQPGQTVSFSLTGGVDQGKFQIVGGQLQFQTAPNYEMPTDANTDNEYVVRGHGTDSGTPALVTVQTVTVTVTPVNDNPPVFTSNATPVSRKTRRRRDPGGHRRGPAGADGQLQPDGRGGPGQVPDRRRPAAVPDGPGLRGADGRQHGQQVRRRGDGHGQRDSGVGHGADRDGDGHAGERQPPGVHLQRARPVSRKTRPAS